MEANFKYEKRKKRLTLWGIDRDKHINTIRDLFENKTIGPDLDTIIYQKDPDSFLSFIIRGKYLKDFIENAIFNKTTDTPNKTFKGILDQISQAGYLESIYGGIVLMCVDTRKILFIKNKNQKEWVIGGDHPNTTKETPREIACRSGASYGIKIDPAVNLFPLIDVKDDTTNYYNFIVFLQREFTPNISENIEHVWATWATMGGKRPVKMAIKNLFDNDRTLNKLVNVDDTSFDLLVEQVLQGENLDDPDDPSPIVA